MATPHLGAILVAWVRPQIIRPGTGPVQAAEGESPAGAHACRVPQRNQRNERYGRDRGRSVESRSFDEGVGTNPKAAGGAPKATGERARSLAGASNALVVATVFLATKMWIGS